MGNITPRRLSLHHFLALTVSHSTTVDPRHLEHHISHWMAADFAALIVSGDLQYSIIAPQFPVYVSPKDPSPGPDDSGRTEADGEAKAIGQKLVGQSLSQFFDEFQPHLRGFSPHCLWVSGHEATLLGELKPGPTRHARHIESFLSNLNTLLRDATLQAEAQALCLFCSWRFGTQDVVLLLAGAGEYYRIRHVTRNWSVVELNGEIYTSKTLKELKTAAKQLDYLGEDGDWTEGQEEEMYGDPGSAEDRQKTLNNKRKHHLWACRLVGFFGLYKLVQAPATRTAQPLFSPMTRSTNSIESKQVETSSSLRPEDPEKYFSGDGPSEWSCVLHGSDLSNWYMTRIQDFIRTFEEREADRRKNVLFRTKPPAEPETPETKVNATAKGKSKDEPKADPKAKLTKDRKQHLMPTLMHLRGRQVLEYVSRLRDENTLKEHVRETGSTRVTSKRNTCIRNASENVEYNSSSTAGVRALEEDHRFTSEAQICRRVDGRGDEAGILYHNVVAMLNTLAEHKNSHQSGNRWKSSVWTPVIHAIHKANPAADPKKDQKKAKSKLEYVGVSRFKTNTGRGETLLQLKSTFETYVFVAKFSGTGWDDTEKHATSTQEYIDGFVAF
ncbi:hypothetical protein DFH07DRAFT_785813 [Mycena maculata]|uniref:Uncharacterized protein n=1 Tax=Mycena maculata TaxID=230809 RepID=A0AAD7MES2_9AGAR|nr:hypothetical protein DFH07DRAFT_785813 [Mycena maculata]